MSRPEFVAYEGQYEDSAFFEIKGMRHPCVQLSAGRDFIPNDTTIDASKGEGLLLVTGPNMGGKSTLLRQTCVAVILAQIGCWVPCESFKLTPVDRIFTRLGASDRILEGKSTFYVEMEETKNVIQFATFKSLAILDELGRGTSTFDGYSIAHAVLNHLLKSLRCRCLFSTHYHMLLDDFRDREGVASYHMSYKVMSEKEVMFLYKFVRGECPMSFGINVARMAGIPAAILERAANKSKEFSKNLDDMKARLRAAHAE
jgi:DNA mismatch repair protein MSH6